MIGSPARSSYFLDYDPDNDDAWSVSGSDLVGHFEKVLPSLPYSLSVADSSCTFAFEETVSTKPAKRTLKFSVTVKASPNSKSVKAQQAEFVVDSTRSYYTRTLHLLHQARPFAIIPDSRYSHQDAPLIHLIDNDGTGLIIGKDTIIIDKELQLYKCSRFDLKKIFR
jgi:hypothetical protein